MHPKHMFGRKKLMIMFLDVIIYFYVYLLIIQTKLEIKHQVPRTSNLRDSTVYAMDLARDFIMLKTTKNNNRELRDI